jgi:hypothetical protein
LRNYGHTVTARVKGRDFDAGFLQQNGRSRWSSLHGWRFGNSLLLAQALANDCTDVLVLLTRPAHYRCEPPTWRRQLFDMICARRNAGVSRAYAHHHETSRAARDLAFGWVPTPPGVNIATICTEAPEIIHRTSGNPFALRQAALDYGARCCGFSALMIRPGIGQLHRYLAKAAGGFLVRLLSMVCNVDLHLTNQFL